MLQSPRRVAAAMLISLALPGGLGAQVTATPERVTITGRVVDEITRVPLSGVVLEFPELGVGVQTDATGQFEVVGIQVGVYRLTLSHPGYRTSSGDFTVMRQGSVVMALVPLDADAGAPAGRFLGRVTDAESGQPLVGVDVQIREVFMGGITGDDGRFRLDAVPPGRHAVEFSTLGYATRVEVLEVVSGQTSDVRVGLAVDPIDMGPIDVTVERRELILEDVGFYERRQEGFGEFIDLQAIEERRPSEMTDLFTRVPGALLVPDPGNPLERSVVLRGGRLGGGARTGGGDHCYPQVVLDGIVVHRGGDAPARIDQFVDPTAVAGVEIFPSSVGVPAQYGGIDAACGVIVLWTRR